MDFKEIIGYWNNEICKEDMLGFPLDSTDMISGSRAFDIKKNLGYSAGQKLSDFRKSSEYLVYAAFLAASSLTCCVLNNSTEAIVGLTRDGIKYNAYKLAIANEMTVREYLNKALKSIKNTHELALSDVVKYLQDEEVRDFCEHKMLLVNCSKNDLPLNKRSVVVNTSCDSVHFEYEGSQFTAASAEKYSDIYVSAVEMLLTGDMNGHCSQLFEKLHAEAEKISSKTESKTAAAENTVGGNDEMIEKIKAAWNDVLDEPVSSIDINFFDAGGYSLLIYKLSAAIEEHTGKKVPFVKLMEYPTIRQLAEGISGESNESPAEPAERKPRRAVRRREWNNE